MSATAHTWAKADFPPRAFGFGQEGILARRRSLRTLYPRWNKIIFLLHQNEL